MKWMNLIIDKLYGLSVFESNSKGQTMPSDQDNRDQSRPPWIGGHHWQHHVNRIEAIHTRLGTIEQLLEKLMANKAEVKADLEAIKAEVTATRGAANSAIALLTKVLGQVNTAAANADDLDEFRTDLKLIMEGTTSIETDLKTAVNTNPAPAGGG